MREVSYASKSVGADSRESLLLPESSSVVACDFVEEYKSLLRIAAVVAFEWQETNVERNCQNKRWTL